MTIDNYTQLSNLELIDKVNELKIDLIHLSRVLKKYHQTLFDEIVFRTKFLDNYYNSISQVVPFPARMFCLKHNITSQPICHNPNCNNPTKWNTSTGSFRKYCCGSCSSSDPEWQKKVEESMLRHIGVRHALQSKEIRDKCSKTCMERYGQSNYAKTDESKIRCKQSWANKTDEELQEIQNKHIFYNQMVYGTDYAFQSEEVKEKSRKTLLIKTGFEYPLQSEEAKNKVRNAWKNKSKQEIDLRTMQSKNTKLKLYGDANYNNHEQTAKTKLATYGNMNYNNREKAKETTFEKYGVENYAQSTEFHKKCRKKYTNEKYPDMTFGSSWEFIVYDFLKEHNIEFEYQPAISIPYEYKGEIHTYHPDFLLKNGRIVEVKGDHFFRINESTGKEEMYCPYRYDDWSDEYYAYKCGLSEAKHQCMLEHDVIIIRENDILSLECVFNEIID